MSTTLLERACLRDEPPSPPALRRTPDTPRCTEGVLAVVVDPLALEGRGRGLLVTAASHVTPELMNRMIHLGLGISVLLVDLHAAFVLGLRDMPVTGANRQRDAASPRYLCSIEAADCASTGISAEDRAHTLRTAGRADAGPEHLVMPGHVVPLLVPPQSSSGRASLHQAALQLVRETSGCIVAAACDILDGEGDIADAAVCEALARRHGLGLMVLAS